MLNGKNILLGITGGIAAYKAAELARLFIKTGAEVKVVMTPAAKGFITPLTMATLSKNPVYSNFVADNDSGRWNNHVELGLWADIVIVAPATANTLAKMATGACDNLLLAVLLSSRCPVYFAPAMDEDMYKYPATQENLRKLASFGNNLIHPGTGELASGLYGEGRMAEPQEILDFIISKESSGLPLSGKKILVTAGPTHEAIDPVRYIGNRSTGKMGFALAEAASRMGAEVHLVAGPTELQVSCNNINRTDVITAEDMYKACIKLFPKMNAAILSAAVADYTPAEVASKKIKKKGGTAAIELKQAKDILAHLGKIKKKGQVLAGFALETDNETENAKKKLRGKNLDFIVLNSLNDKGAGFGHSTNKVTIIDSGNEIEAFGLKPKKKVAHDILGKVATMLYA